MDGIEQIVRLALSEDSCFADRTSQAIVPDDHRSSGKIVAREQLVLSGSDAVLCVYRLVDPSVSVDFDHKDGQLVEKNDVIARVAGRTRSILAGERVALNFLQHLCGVATQTRRFCDAVSGTAARIADTRKTLPGLRALEKKAVADGGGVNHRMSLADGILIKENHIRAAGSIAAAVTRARRAGHHLLKVEVEVETLQQVREAMEAFADAILLDNMSVEMIASALKIVAKRAFVEASGNVTLENVAEIARTGVDLISVGRLTHSAPACDISLELL